MRIPTPEKYFARLLTRAPTWVQAFVENFIAIAQWLGLPAAFLAFFTDRQWIADALLKIGQWLSERLDFLTPFANTTGLGLVGFSEFWRNLTAPLRTGLSNVIGVEIGQWIIDVCVILLLLFLGAVRAEYLRQLGRAAALKSVNEELKIASDGNIKAVRTGKRPFRYVFNLRRIIETGKKPEGLQDVEQQFDEQIHHADQRARYAWLIYLAAVGLCFVLLAIDWIF